MRIVDPGHKYLLDVIDDESPDGLQYELCFVKREGDKYPGNVGHYPGVNIQEILRALIDRIQYLNNQIPDIRNDQILDNFRYCLYLLEERAADRHNRQFFKIMQDRIEDYPYCNKCGHIGCNGECHE